MTLPVAVAASSLRWSVSINTRHVIVYNGVPYAVLADRTNNTIQVYQYSSGTETWATFGPTHAIHTSQLETFDVTLTGSTLIAGFFPTTGWMRWSGIDLSSGSPSWTDSTAASGNTATLIHPSGAYPWFVCRRSDGTTVMVIAASMTSMGADYARTRVHVWTSGGGASVTAYEMSAGSTTLDTSTQTHYALRSVIQVGDRVHIFYTEHTSGAFAGLKHRTLESDNSFGTIGTVDSTPIGGAADTTPYTCGLGCTWDDSGTTRIVQPYVDSNGALTVARAATGSNPTFTTQAVSGTSTNDPEYTTANPGAAFADGTTVHLLWPDDTTLDVYHSKSAAGGAWDTPDEWKDAVAVAGLNAITATGLVGVLYDDGGTVNYDEYSLASGTTNPITPSGALTPAGNLDVQLQRRFTATATPAGIVAKQERRTLTASMTPSGVQTKRTDRTLPGASTPAGTLALSRVLLRSFAGTAASAGALRQNLQRTFSGALTPNGLLTRTLSRSLGGTSTSAGAVTKRSQRSFTGSVTSSGAVVRRVSRTLAGALTPADTLTRQTAKTFVGAMETAVSLMGGGFVLMGSGIELMATIPAMSASVTHKTIRAVAGAVASSGAATIERSNAVIPISVGGTVASAGTVARRISRALAGSSSSSGAIVRETRRSLTGSATPAGTLTTIRTKIVAFGGSVASSGTLTKQAPRAFVASIASSGIQARQVKRTLTGTVVNSGAISIIRSMLRTFTGALAPSGVARTNPQISRAGAVPSAGSLRDQVSRGLVGTIASSATLATQRTVMITASGTLTSSSVLVRRVRIMPAGVVVPAGTLSHQAALLFVGTVAIQGAIATQGGVKVILSSVTGGDIAAAAVGGGDHRAVVVIAGDRAAVSVAGADMNGGTVSGGTWAAFGVRGDDRHP